MSATTQAFIGKGSIYIEEIGSDKGLLPIGNCPDFSLSFGEDKKEMKDSEGQGGGVVASLSRISSVTGTINSFSFSKENLAMSLRAMFNTEAKSVITDEVHVAKINGFISFKEVPDMSTIVVKDDAGTTTFTAGTDYEVKSSGIVIIGGAITADDDLKISYTGKGVVSIEMLTSSSKEYRLVFDGLNEAQSGEAVEITCHKIKFSPTSGLPLIGDDFAQLTLAFDILKDETIKGAGISPFARIRMV